MFQSITLEVSLKPFKQTCEAFIRKTCQGIFKQWKPLLKGRQEISIMLWVGDGSELLDYDGDLEKEFEWAYFIGTANLPLIDKDDDPAISLHSKKRLYIENPPKMTYFKLYFLQYLLIFDLLQLKCLAISLTVLFLLISSSKHSFLISFLSLTIFCSNK